MRRLPPFPHSSGFRAVNPAEFVATFSDIEMMALLGKYYAAKIRGATELALYRATRDRRHQELAVQHLNARRGFLEGLYGARELARTDRYWTNRVGHVDWQELDAEVLHDVDLARARRYPRTEPGFGKTLTYCGLEAEQPERRTFRICSGYGIRYWRRNGSISIR